MAVTKEQWATMTSKERRELRETNLAQAASVVKSEGLPTGIKVVIGGLEHIARPARVTESGGVTYSISPKSTMLGKRSARFNKFSFTLLGEGAASAEASFDDEHYE